jgi:hypothetical protein
MVQAGAIILKARGLRIHELSFVAALGERAAHDPASLQC